MKSEIAISIEATPERIWATLTDVQNWPRGIDTYQFVQRLEDGELRVGSQAAIKQTGPRKTVWTVTGLASGRRFAWESLRPACPPQPRTSSHPSPPKKTRLVLRNEQHGALAGVL